MAARRRLLAAAGLAAAAAAGAGAPGLAHVADSQRQAAKDLRLRIVGEPAAASLAYGLEKGNETAVFFDPGADTFEVPEVPLEGLLAAAPGAVEEARRALSELGVLAVAGVADDGGAPLGAAADAALRAWARCLSVGGSARGEALVRPLAGGRVRRVSVTAGGRWGASPGRLAPPCGAAAAATQKMRQGLRRATRALAAALEQPGSAAAGLALSGAVERGSHLEHLHLYEDVPDIDDRVEDDAGEESGVGRRDPVKSLETAALDLHTDAGLLLAFVPPLMAAGSPSGADGAVEVELPDGRRRALAAPWGSVVFLAGEASRLLQWPAPAAAWRPAPHALRLGAGFGWRAWFGAMLLPPPDTPVPAGPGAQAPAVPFGALWEAARLELADQAPAGGAGPGALGCGGGLRLADQAGTCPEGTISCWMTCMSTAGLESCQGQIWARVPGAGSLARPTNLSVQCREKGSGKVWPTETGGMCQECQPMCTLDGQKPTPPPAPAVGGAMCRSSDAGPGTGSGTTMYMDGLRLTSVASDEVCVAFLAPSLVIDQPWKLALACLVGAALSACIEAVTILRQRLPTERQGDVGLICQITSHLLVYSVMLLVMTYSVELFFAVVFGLSFGHAAGRHASRKRRVTGTAGASADDRFVVEGLASMTALASMTGLGVVAQTHLEVTLDVEGMVCAACVAKVTKSLVAMEGVVSAAVNLELQEAEVVYQPFVRARDLCGAVTEAGYTAFVRQSQDRVERSVSAPARSVSVNRMLSVAPSPMSHTASTPARFHSASNPEAGFFGGAAASSSGPLLED